MDTNLQWIDEFLSWPIDHYNTEIKLHPELAESTVEIYSSMIAIDYMRKLGIGEEKKHGQWFIFENAGRELAEAIADKYPYYWGTMQD